ncbi:MAG TPA: lasso peptide biosynthesis B2 protein [Geminicoccaceae bacterium]|jgi:hypothetical protein|nr:lasso peptide biosynthesis B2 protein [Geminicoccaceae bacterium]
MTYLALEAHVSYGLAGGRPVFLDLRRDRYTMLDGPAERAFLPLCAGDKVPRDDETFCQLLATGLFKRAPVPCDLLPAAVARPEASLLDDLAGSRASLAGSLRAWRAVARARRRLHTVPLAEIVEAKACLAGPSTSGEAAATAAREFLAARALVPIERSCLLDALALLDWLGDLASHVTLVFGVRLQPFRAHCWVQADRLLLTDAADEVGRLTPVLAV